MAYVDDYRQQIIETIDGWTGKLTWGSLTSSLQERLNLKKKPSRHTLILHDDIKNAFDKKKKSLKEKKEDMLQRVEELGKNPDDLGELLSELENEDATIAALIKKAKDLEKENEKHQAECKRLESEKTILLEQFVRWQSNLSRMDGVDMNKLLSSIDEPLSRKDVR